MGGPTVTTVLLASGGSAACPRGSPDLHLAETAKCSKQICRYNEDSEIHGSSSSSIPSRSFPFLYNTNLHSILRDALSCRFGEHIHCRRFHISFPSHMRITIPIGSSTYDLSAILWHPSARTIYLHSILGGIPQPARPRHCLLQEQFPTAEPAT